MRTAAASSEHPLATHAVGECVGALLERGGPEPDALVLFVTAPLVGALEDIVAASRQLLEPAVTIGASAVSVLAGAREVEVAGALAAFALWNGPRVEDELAEPVGRRPTGVRLDARRGPDGPEVAGLDALAGAAGTLVLLADPFSCPVDAVLAQLAVTAPQLAIAGGFASAAHRPGANRLVLDAAVHSAGAVGLLLPEGIGAGTVLSQGARAVGEPMTVTSVERNLLVELAGRPALERLHAVVQALGPEDRDLAARALHIGRVIDEPRHELARGDFLIRPVTGADRGRGVLAVDDEVTLGATVQFHLRDADAARDDLVGLLGEGPGASGALVFAGSDRGSALFGVPDQDAIAVSESLRGAPVAGMFCAGEFGRVGGTNFVHGAAASVVLLD